MKEVKTNGNVIQNKKNSLFEIIVSNRYQVNKEVNSNGWNKLKIHCTFKIKKIQWIFLHLFSDYPVIVPVAVVRTGVVTVRYKADILILIHVHIADIGAVLLIIAVKRTACTAVRRFLFLHFIHS